MQYVVDYFAVPANLIAFLGIGFVFASFLMTGMFWLRVLAVGGNLCFITYGLVEWQLPSLIMNFALLPVNLKRLWEIKRLTLEIRRATELAPVLQLLLPNMTRHSFAADQVLFRKGDKADEIAYIDAGEVAVEGRSTPLGAGELIGEIGVFSPNKVHTKTVTARTGGVLYRMTAERIYQLYYQHPAIGFCFMRLVAERLLHDVQTNALAPRSQDAIHAVL